MRLTVGAAPVSVWSHGYAVSALQPTSAIRSIPFLFIHFRTLLRNGDIPTPFLSITCALFPVQWGVGVHSTAQLPEFRTFFQVTYARRPFVPHSYKIAGVWSHSFPNRSAYLPPQPANITPPLFHQLRDLCVENTRRPRSVCAPSADRSVPNVFVRSCTSFTSSSSAFHS